MLISANIPCKAPISNLKAAFVLLIPLSVAETFKGFIFIMNEEAEESFQASFRARTPGHHKIKRWRVRIYTPPVRAQRLTQIPS